MPKIREVPIAKSQTLLKLPAVEFGGGNAYGKTYFEPVHGVCYVPVVSVGDCIGG